ncbi:hypothetical protein AZE42_12613 [Rhizopogon vesiculosus]|uniref:Uncharacterized protein n=1 Tax=Rhizopogon vesiculosus TaxID=180088 RepID=A0A1J8Q0G8_9AGAM|nr:hypothetical protein AZE42_12613 [Rhizopogon vesiculosus]
MTINKAQAMGSYM